MSDAPPAIRHRASTGAPCCSWSRRAAILMITMGMRQSLGLFIAPIIDSTHVGYAAMSFALAVGQLMWGVAQPTFGALADRYGAQSACCSSGALMLAAGSALTPFAGNEFALIVTIGVLTAAGAGAGSFARAHRRGRAARAGRTSARSPRGSSMPAAASGQFVFAPLNQLLISTIGWMGAMWAMAVAALATIPLARPLLARARRGRHARRAADGTAPAAPARSRMREQLRDRRARQELLVPARRVLHLRLPHRVSRHASARRSEAVQPARLRGRQLARHHRPRQRRRQPVGRLGRRRDAHEVAVVRDVLHPRRRRGHLPGRAQDARSPSTCSPRCWASPGSRPCRRPPGSSASCSACVISRRLFGLATFTHQIGGFFGAWLGGIALTRFGDFSWMWYADIALALAAAFVNLPIREAKLVRPGSRKGSVPVPESWPRARGSGHPSGPRGAALSGKHLAIERGVRHAEVIAQHALHHRAQVARRLEVAALVADWRATGPANRRSRGRRRPRRLTRMPRRRCRDPCRACR